MNYLRPNLSYVVLNPLYSTSIWRNRQERRAFGNWPFKPFSFLFLLDCELGEEIRTPVLE